MIHPGDLVRWKPAQRGHYLVVATRHSWNDRFTYEIMLLETMTWAAASVFERILP